MTETRSTDLIASLDEASLSRFHLRAALVAADGEHLLHTLDDAASFFVFPAGGESGSVLLSGRWSMEEIGASTPIGRA